MQTTNVTKQMLEFRDFLVHSWKNLDLLMEQHDWESDGSFITDWIQVNWEFLVERELLRKTGFLKSYSYDDFRVTFPDAVATYEIICKPIEHKQLIDDRTGAIIPDVEKLFFGGFENKMEFGYGCYPPFDFITAFTKNKKLYYELPVVNLEFYLTQIGNR